MSDASAESEVVAERNEASSSADVDGDRRRRRRSCKKTPASKRLART